MRVQKISRCPERIAILRISGGAAFAIARALVGRLPPPRHAALRALRDPGDATLIDRALVLVFPAPHTATGEDLVELHVHGGHAVVAAVSRAISARPGARLAEPGEFTRRALANGVIDLTAAEGLGDLLAAETETQRRAALRMAEGGLRVMVERWTRDLVGIAARIEAQLDFSDEDDVAVETDIVLTRDIAIICNEISVLIATPPAERLRDGVRVVIAGPPNSGKSTLLNALAGRDIAIVSSVSGTTRDRIEAPVGRAGIAYVLTDTAGLTDLPTDVVERIGIERAERAMAEADVVLWLGDDAPPSPTYIHVHARADEPARADTPSSVNIAISAKTGFGLEDLWRLLGERASSLLPQADTIALNDRQRAAMSRCLDSLLASDDPDLLIVAEEVRRAILALNQVTGRSGIDDLLDAIFARFCIGK